MPLSAVALQLWGGHRDQCMRCGHQDLVQLVRNSALPPLRQLLFPRWTVPGTLSLKAYDAMLQVDNKQGGRLRIPFELVHCST
jgi:hypothetical protein